MSKWRLRQPVHVIRKTFPGPGNAGAQHRLRNILDAFHQLDQPDVIGRPAGREADAAIAHDRGGDAVLRRGRDVLAPGDLAVIMGVDVDKARRRPVCPWRRSLPCPWPATRPTSVMRPSVIATSASNSSPPRPSAMVPPRITRSGLLAMAFHPGVGFVAASWVVPLTLSTAAGEVQGCISPLIERLRGAPAGRGR